MGANHSTEDAANLASISPAPTTAIPASRSTPQQLTTNHSAQNGVSPQVVYAADVSANDVNMTAPTMQQPPPPQSLTDRVKTLVDPNNNHQQTDNTNMNQQMTNAVPSSLIVPPTPQGAAATATTLLPTPNRVDTVLTVFKWVHGGHEVFVTGSFNQWLGKIPMNKVDGENEFILQIDILPGTHTYKYIVDGEWRVDEDAAQYVTYDGTVNNVVEVKRPVFQFPTGDHADSDDEDADEKKTRQPYTTVSPAETEYVLDPKQLPPQLTQILLNHSSPSDSALLPVPEHVGLNHLYVQSTDPTLLVTGITQRFKPNSHAKITHKFVTTVYYSPQQDINTFIANNNNLLNNNNNNNNNNINMNINNINNYQQSMMLPPSFMQQMPITITPPQSQPP